MSESLELEAQTDADFFDPKAMAVIKRAGELVYLEATSLRDLKEELKNHNLDSVVAVWKGKKLTVKSEVKTTTTISFQ